MADKPRESNKFRPTDGHLLILASKREGEVFSAMDTFLLPRGTDLHDFLTEKRGEGYRIFFVYSRAIVIDDFLREVSPNGN
ncbi:hypothetical protein I532_03965 [Brevibacillus borstelensis AK1]|uniref:Uncharacterized protein n=1 Tax=Brevibacillus borstelensis AK1 TaxID=1300222 RepID=M8E649_9BACL|nr:hypothetical protein [Brevibacillus borstelensis]EMT54731.1 hypothetical protein I532_03965 [Brevibacillus borstelensis AK1]